MSDNILGALAIVLIFGMPIVGILTHHSRKVLELKLKLKQGAEQNEAGALQDIRQQIADLRDTTTRYDLSFDAALQRIESRMSHVEQRVGALESSSEASRAERV